MSRRPVRKTLGWLWRWSLMVTIPVTCFFVLWMVRVGDKYWSMGIKYQTLENEVNLQTLAKYEGSLIKRDLQLAITPASASAARQLRAIEMYVPEGSESALNANLPHSGKTYVPASLVYPNGDLLEVKMRYRGDHFWHWAGRKKSLRVKTKKSSLFERTRAFNLTAPKMPEQISGYLSYYLAHQFDLIAPDCDLVDLYVNSEYRGVHVFLEQLEEMVVRKCGKMPGDLYAADIVGKDSYRGLSSRAFGNAGLWEKVAINNHFDEGENEAIERLVAAITAPSSHERTQTLRELVDLEAFGRFAAFRVLCQTEHYDNTHNWRLYYDPWRNSFQPVVWDPVGWALAWRPKLDRRTRPDIVSSLLDEALMEDHAFLAARQTAVEDFYARGGDKELLAELDRIAAASKPSFETDPSITYKILHMTPDAVELAVQRFRRSVRTIINQTREDYLTSGRLDYVANGALSGAIRVEVSGRRPVTTLSIGLSKPVTEQLSARLIYLSNTGPEQLDVTGALVQRGARIELELPLFAQIEPDPDYEGPPYLSPGYRTLPGQYEIVLDGPSMVDNPVVDVTGRVGDGSSIPGRLVDAITPTPFAFAQGVVDAAPSRIPQIWEGDLSFTGVQRIAEDVIIRPGTTLSMAAGSSIIFEGQLRARGTEESPIVIGPAVEGQEPWGVIAIRGDMANGSELSHCRMRLGSGLKAPMAEFSAMLSIHDVDNMVVRDCLFEDSKVVDDMVHAVYSTVHFDGCAFVRSLFDALDLDITTGTVENCQFLASGNDALDLMTSTILVKSCWIESSFDKGVSVGEDTDAMIIGTVLKDCEIGVQIKDRSRAVVYNCELRGNKLGLDAYKKNWRYDSGGFGFIYKSLLLENDVTLSADKHSVLRLHDNGLDVQFEGTKRIIFDPTNSFDGSENARYDKLIRYPEEEVDASVYFQGAWSGLNLGVRGASTSH